MSATGIVTRRATADDLPRLTAWMLAFFAHLADSSADPYFADARLTPAEAEAAMTATFAGDDLLLVAEWRDRPAGYLLASLDAPFVRESPIRRIGRIAHCYVEPAARGQGITRQLAGSAEAWFRLQGIRYVELSYIDANDLAAAVWPRLGYRRLRSVARKDLAEGG